MDNKKKRLVELCDLIWEQLSVREHDAYHYTSGLTGFVKDVAALIKFDINELTSKEIDEIIDLLFIQLGGKYARDY